MKTLRVLLLMPMATICNKHVNTMTEKYHIHVGRDSVVVTAFM